MINREEYKVLKQRMLGRGSHRRPQWQLNDFPWHIKEPAY